MRRDPRSEYKYPGIEMQLQGIKNKLVFVICSNSRLLQHYDIMECDYFPIECPYPKVQQSDNRTRGRWRIEIVQEDSVVDLGS